MQYHMIEKVTKSNLNEYEEFLMSHPKGHFLQSCLWSGVKGMWEFDAIICRGADGKIKGSMAVLIRKVSKLPYTIMYAPRGFVCDLDDKETFGELIEGIKESAKKYHSYILKTDPDVPVDNTEFTDMLKSFGFEYFDIGSNFSTVQPKFVFRMNILNKTEDEILNSFESKTRYNIRLAERKGVEVVQFFGYDGLDKCTDEENRALNEFAVLMRETGSRDNFAIRDKDYFYKIMKSMGVHARLYIAYFEGKAIAGTLPIYYGDKVWYLYGASSNSYRNVMPNYLLQWTMIKWAIQNNCRIYDFRGVSGNISEDNPLYGIYKFKKGFNGEFTEFCGEYDYVFNRPVNKVLRFTEDCYLKARRKIMKKRRKA